MRKNKSIQEEPNNGLACDNPLMLPQYFHEAESKDRLKTLPPFNTSDTQVTGLQQPVATINKSGEDFDDVLASDHDFCLQDCLKFAGESRLPKRLQKPDR